MRQALPGVPPPLPKAEGQLTGICAASRRDNRTGLEVQ